MQWSNDIFPVWYVIRAAGLTSYVLLFMSVVSGVLQSLPLIRGRARGVLYAFHCATCWYGWMFGMAHGVLLLLDNKVNYTLTDILIPFTAHYMPLQTAFGIVAFYIMSLLVLSSWVMKRIGRKFWRAIHFLSFPGYLFALYHGVSLGTDSLYPGIKLLYVLTGGIVFALVFLRLTVVPTNKKDRVPARKGRGPELGLRP
ncbi:MAG TPA: ferric reductase [Spirochaetia bacterium]|nr:ferric reductase [Spirochaetia bacterium]